VLYPALTFYKKFYTKSMWVSNRILKLKLLLLQPWLCRPSIRVVVIVYLPPNEACGIGRSSCDSSCGSCGLKVNWSSCRSIGVPAGAVLALRLAVVWTLSPSWNLAETGI